MAVARNQTRLATLAGTAAALVAAGAAQKIVAAGWKAARGHKPPSADDLTGETGIGEVVAAAVITGALVALARVLATRGTATVAARISPTRPA